MGTQYTYVCRHCGWQALVAGGTATGLAAKTSTVMCLDCRELYDIYTAERGIGGPGQPTEQEYNKNKRYPIPRYLLKNIWRPLLRECPENPGHRIRAWRKKVCPKCGGPMRRPGKYFKGGDMRCEWD